MCGWIGNGILAAAPSLPTTLEPSVLLQPGAFSRRTRNAGALDAPRALFVVSCAPMDREQLAEQLRQAEHHIAEATALIERQRERVREFAEAGHDTEIAETALRALESNLRAFERHRDSVLSWMKSSEDAPPSENG